MAQQKFFSGLTEGMINRSAGERPDRQKTHFFWPDEYAPDVEAPKGHTQTVGARSGPPPPQTATNGRADDRGGHRGPGTTRPPSSTINGRLFGSQETGVDEVDERRAVRGQRPERGEEGEQLMAAGRARPANNTASHIQFYDAVESSFGELERSRAHERRRIEQFLRQQSEEDTGEAARAKRLSTLQSKIEFYDYPEPSPAEPRVIIHRGFGGSARSVQDSPPRSRTTSRQGGHPGELDADTGPYQDDEFEFDDRSSVRSSVCSSSYAPSLGYHRTAHTDLPEHKRNSQRHLRSSINFHNGCTVADDSEAPRKTVSVRESATSRVGVGLPNL
uniref:Uncharacterized protein n=1 Tax=Anopheles atroparvus TaxID=41427 RepID=A0A182IRW9_ANOAO